MIRHTINSITFRYIFALGLIAVLIIAAYSTVSRTVVSRRANAAVINISGKQRCLTQCAVIYSLSFLNKENQAEREVFRKKLLEVVRSLEIAHNGLMYGNPDMALPGKPSARVKSIYFDPPVHLDRQMKDFIGEVRALVYDTNGRPSRNNPHMKYIFTAATSKLLESLDAAVKQYQEECETSDIHLQKMKTGVLILTLFVLAMEGVFIFRPMAARIREDKRTLIHSETRIRSIIDNATDGFIAMNNEGIIELFNRAAEKMFGYSSDEAKGYDVGMLMPESHRCAFDDYIYNFLCVGEFGTRGLCVYETAGRRKDESVFSMEMSVSTSYIEGQRLFILNVRDVTEQKQLMEKFRKLSQAVEQSPVSVIITDIKGNIEYVNEKFVHLTGYSVEEILGKNPRVLKSGYTMPEEYKGLWDAIKSGNEWRGVFYNKKKSGEFYWERALISPIKSTQNGITHFLAIKEDISEQKRFESQLEYMANHDSLTNLFNRRRFLEELKSRLAETRRFGTPGALVFLDMDNFKYVNDTLGHHKGDELLMKFASLLRDRMRETDVLARLGGDEFAIILPRTGREQALLISEHFMKYVRDSVGPDLGDTCRVTISIGIALFPEHGSDAETLLMYADMAMYRAKEEGRNRVCLYESVHKTHIETKVNWERRICDALIKEGNFLLHLQPVRDLRRNRIAGYEALLRMKDERGEIIFPADFLAIAERFGLIHDIDRWVVRRAIFVASKLNLAAKGLRLEINLSGKAFTDQKLLPLIKREFDENKISPGIFIFEITETASIENISAATYFIDNLKEMGCRFAIDDFGIGFSSFNYLKHLPVDYLKIDGSFICNLPKSSVDRHLVRAMVEVACGIGKQTIAEYVDSEETVLLLKEYGVDYAQGYYIGKPKAWPLLLDEGREGLLIAKEKCRG